MTTETKGIEIKNKGLLIFGILLLLIGLGASFYSQAILNSIWVYDPNNPLDLGHREYVEIGRTYPYQSLGMVLVLAGIIFVALGFFYSPRKTEPIKPST